MNILHHKSWHVRNKDNIERVRKDEAKAAEEERVKQNKIVLAEQEARTQYLRNKSRQKLNISLEDNISSQDTSLVSADDKPKHLNLFEDIEKGFGIDAKNKEYEEEKKLEKEKWEKSIGLLTYLGQTTLEEKEVPWYKKIRQVKNDSDNISDELFWKKKKLMDPLNDMNKFVDKKKKLDGSDKFSKFRKDDQSSHSEAKSQQTKSSSSIEQMRAERLKREKSERLKAELVIAKSCGIITEKEEVVMDDRKRRYNSQYNPDYVKRKRF